MTRGDERASAVAEERRGDLPGSEEQPSLAVLWDDQEAGRLERTGQHDWEYVFRYTDATRPISLSLPLGSVFSPSQSRPFFEGLLPEGAMREQIARQLRLAPSDTFALLAELGRDCAGALRLVEHRDRPDVPSVRWLDAAELDDLIDELPRHPLGVSAGEQRMRLSLAGVQDKAVLVRAPDGRFGLPLDGMASTHIVKPERPDASYPGLARNEHFCMSLAARCDLPAAKVELARIAGRSCLVVERFDRDRTAEPATRIHQEDLCQALGLLPDFKYQRENWRLPSQRALAELLDRHSPTPGLDRLASARAAVFHFLVGNADAHAKNVSLLHVEGVRLAPLYDVVSTAAYPDLSRELSLAIGDELDPEKIGPMQWDDLAEDLGLRPAPFARVRADLAARTLAEAKTLQAQARTERWHHDCIDTIVQTIAARAELV